VQRLEQVRLPGAVRADREDEAGREVEVERRVRPEVAQCDVGDERSGRL